MTSKPIRIELETESDELVILEQLDDRDITVAIMDGEGDETRARIRGAELQRALTYMLGAPT